MGDVFHMFPALSDALEKCPDLQVDWVVEKAFSEIPRWHPSVNNVFAVELRKWRKSISNKTYRIERKRLFQTIQQRHKQAPCDFMLDAQGLLKSVWVARRIAKQNHLHIVGFAAKSVREPLAALF